MEYYPRKIEQDLEKWLKRREIILIKGPRQSGKTTLLLHLKEKLGGEYLTLEDEDMLKAVEKAPKEFARRFIDQERKNLFVDEAQYCKDVGKKLKLIFDLFSDKLKLIVTGSGSFDIKVEIGKHLVGRAVYLELLPLDFDEFLRWKAKDLHKIFLEYKKALSKFVLGGKMEVEPVFEREFNSLLSEHVLFGGFPAIVKEANFEVKKELLKNLVRTYVERDVFFFLSVRNIEKFRRLLSYLSYNVGSLVEISSLMKELRLDYKTAENYLSILVDTYLISFLSPFYKSLVTELRKARKIYFRDLGLRNSLINNFLPMEGRADKGILLENQIYNELASNFKDRINYWRTSGKAEVDFILKINEELIPVEVKTKPKLGRGFLSFISTYKPRRALIFTENEFGVKKIKNTEVALVPFFFI